jgi:hypothetical protein
MSHNQARLELAEITGKINDVKGYESLRLPMRILKRKAHTLPVTLARLERPQSLPSASQ